MSAARPLAIALACRALDLPGGREHQCLAIAAALAARGHAVTILCSAPPAAAPPGVSLERFVARGWTNHGRLAAFAADAASAASGRFDRTVAFHLVPGFDLVFCAELPRARSSPLWRLSPRL